MLTGAPEQAPLPSSDRGRGVQRLALVLNPLREREFAPLRKLLEIDLYDPEDELFRPMNIPRGLKRLVHLDAF